MLNIVHFCFIVEVSKVCTITYFDVVYAPWKFKMILKRIKNISRLLTSLISWLCSSDIETTFKEHPSFDARNFMENRQSFFKVLNKKKVEKILLRVTILWFVSSPNPGIFVIRMFNTLVDFTGKELFWYRNKNKENKKCLHFNYRDTSSHEKQRASKKKACV